MKTINTCCGSHVRKSVKKMVTPLPPNPIVRGGVAVIYIGTGNMSLKGSGTGAVYHASDHSRHFRVYNEDLDSVLLNYNIILKP